MTFPAYYALYAVAHMNRFGTTEEDLARVAVKAHHYASMNPLAQFQKEITIEKVLSSQVVSWPLKLYDACPITDGSAAVVLASEDVARKLTDTPIWIKGIGVSSDSANLSRRDDYVGLAATVDASRKAYSRSQDSPGDGRRGELSRLLHHRGDNGIRGPGLLREGRGGQAPEGRPDHDRRQDPVNVDGGLKAKGHPVGATGVSMMVEISKQLTWRGRQAAGPDQEREGLMHNVGGNGALLLRDGAVEEHDEAWTPNPQRFIHEGRCSLRYNIPISKTHQFWDSLKDGQVRHHKVQGLRRGQFPAAVRLPAVHGRQQRVGRPGNRS